MSRFGLSAFGSLSIIANLQLAAISEPFWVPRLRTPCLGYLLYCLSLVVSAGCR